MATATITPTDIKFGSAQLTVAGTDIGATDGGIKFTATLGIKKIFVDQSTMPQGHFITQEEAGLTANLTEYNLTKIDSVMAGGTYTLDAGATKKKIEFGGGQIVSGDYVELIVTPIIDGSSTLTTDNNLKITIYKCIPIKHPELSFMKDGIRYIPVQFDAKADTTKTAGKQLFMLGDSTAAA